MADPAPIRNQQYARRLLLFTGLKYGAISPTNLDFSCDFGGRWFAFGEAKWKGTPLPTGQRRHLEALCDRINASGEARAVAFVAEYDQEGDVEFGQCWIEHYYWRHWVVPTRPVTVQEFTNRVSQLAACYRKPG